MVLAPAAIYKEVSGLKLLSLTLRNFKGIKNFTLDTQGGNADIYGDNATGKTTLADAFMWLLFDKDSNNRKDFEIKTLGPDGEPEHGLEHTVEAILQLEDGSQIALKKVFREKWTKKRGSASAEFTGHTTDHFVDGVPVKKKEYDEKIAEIADEEIFRLLTDPRYFNEVLHWQKRRELLLEVCGDVSDQEVVSSNNGLSRLAEILGKRTIEQHRKVILARRAEINRELDKIPVRIDEVELGLPRIDDITNPDELPNDIANLRSALKKKQEELAHTRAGGQVAELTKKLRMIEGQMLKEKNRMTGEASERADKKTKELWQINDAALKTKSNIDYYKLKSKSIEVEIGNLEEKMESLRKEWRTENAKTFEFEQSETCPTCRQPLPVEQLKAAEEKAMAQFNKAKAEKLEAINAEGKQLAARKTALEVELKGLLQEQEKMMAELSELEMQKASIQQEIQAIQDGLKQVGPSPEYIQLQKQCEELEEQIQQAQDDVSAAVAKIQKEIDELSDAIRALEQAAARIETREKSLKRIKELKAEERRLAAEYEELEHQLYLTDEFIRTKVRLLEEKINSKFKMSKFKLFDVQVNGALAECCDTTYDGVPYSNLNNGARLNIGLDIINTLADHYGFAPVVFIDNAESVVNILPTKGQQIRLIVSAADKKLRIELAEKKELKEAI